MQSYKICVTLIGNDVCIGVGFRQFSGLLHLGLQSTPTILEEIHLKDVHLLNNISVIIVASLNNNWNLLSFELLLIYIQQYLLIPPQKIAQRVLHCTLHFIFKKTTKKNVINIAETYHTDIQWIPTFKIKKSWHSTANTGYCKSWHKPASWIKMPRRTVRHLSERSVTKSSIFTY